MKEENKLEYLKILLVDCHHEANFASTEAMSGDPVKVGQFTKALDAEDKSEKERGEVLTANMV
ncbi:MAG: hypothetical protein FJW36_21800 [Acidobacteria bacterium]|nr:hypothetical protein [Acidobacteriota bacterium]